jgi:4-hydroxy-tetrahydrodipicolinate synthase
VAGGRPRVEHLRPTGRRHLRLGKAASKVQAKPMFKGTFTALVTPFRSGEIDFEAFEHLVETQISSGVTGIVVVGTTGESPTLSHTEQERLIELTVGFVRGRCKVLAGTGSNSTRDTLVSTRRAERLRANGALVVAPYYNKPNQEGLFRHFRDVAQSTSLPLMLYNIPGRCGVDIQPETVVRLAEECSNIVSIKEASGSVARVSDLRARLPNAFTILSGDDSLTLPFMSVGAVGVVSVASNLFPAEVRALVEAFNSGDMKLAGQLHLKLLPVFQDLFIEPNPVPVKTALSWRGAMSGECRLPLCEMSEANEKRLRESIVAFERARA